ncbi:hypothetical protein PHET_06220 [Paragonimus heterotremus]|uniref:ZZ-type domain-containing protein n=1 Tax=Paragonimus heterotremus TaxID=100268 RepID=A0A8J4TJW1_9TREM|nr:hypothetical protein PHET_06220 [Paragonimus heterotremus]
MFVLRIAFPSVNRAEKFVLYEWPFRSSVRELTWEGFVNRLNEQTKTKRGKFYVSWHDGEEYCTISTTKSLQEAIQSMIRKDPQTNPLLFVFPVTSEEDHHKLSAFFGGCLPEELPRDFRESVGKAEELNESDYSRLESDTSYELVCTSCQRPNWPGDKFACVVCPRVVYCGECYQDGSVHTEHPFLVTRQGAPFPNPLLRAIKAVVPSINIYDSSDEEGSTPDTASVCDLELGSSVYNETSFRDSNVIVPTTVDPVVAQAIGQLRDMGFEQDYAQLYQLAVEEHGDVNNMIEKLTS